MHLRCGIQIWIHSDDNVVYLTFCKIITQFNTYWNALHYKIITIFFSPIQLQFILEVSITTFSYSRIGKHQIANWIIIIYSISRNCQSISNSTIEAVFILIIIVVT